MCVRNETVQLLFGGVLLQGFVQNSTQHSAGEVGTSS